MDAMYNYDAKHANDKKEEVKEVKDTETPEPLAKEEL